MKMEETQFCISLLTARIKKTKDCGIADVQTMSNLFFLPSVALTELKQALGKYKYILDNSYSITINGASLTSNDMVLIWTLCA
jgi:hypothetical protein